MFTVIFLGISQYILTHIFSDIWINPKLSYLAAILNLKCVPSYKVSQMELLGLLTYFVKKK